MRGRLEQPFGHDLVGERDSFASPSGVDEDAHALGSENRPAALVVQDRLGRLEIRDRGFDLLPDPERRLGTRRRDCGDVVIRLRCRTRCCERRQRAVEIALDRSRLAEHRPGRRGTRRVDRPVGERGRRVMSERKRTLRGEEPLVRGEIAAIESPQCDRQEIAPAPRPRRDHGVGETQLMAAGRQQRQPSPARVAVQGLRERRDAAATVAPHLEQAVLFQSRDGGLRHERDEDAERHRFADGDDRERTVLLVVLAVQSGLDQVEQLRPWCPVASHGPSADLASQRPGPLRVADQLAQEQRAAGTALVERGYRRVLDGSAENAGEQLGDVLTPQGLELEHSRPIVAGQRGDHRHPLLRPRSAHDIGRPSERELVHDRRRLGVEEMRVVDEHDRRGVPLAAHQRRTDMSGEQRGLGPDGLRREELGQRPKGDVLHERTPDDPSDRTTGSLDIRRDLAQHPGLADPRGTEDDDSACAVPSSDRGADDLQLLVAAAKWP
jgi:hypothetical protein